MPTVEKTYTVDSRGVGGQDYTQPIPGAAQPKATGSTAYTLQDMGELATRMGSPVTFDRRGDVVWYDDFESGLRWVDLIGGGVVLTPTNSFHGFLCMRKRILAGGLEYANVDVPRLMTNRVGGEFTFEVDSFTIGAVLGVSSLSFWPTIVTPGYTHAARIRYVNAGSLLQYWTAAGAWATIGSYFIDSTRIHTIKLVINPPEGKYERLLVDGSSWDIRNKTYPKTALAFAAAVNGAYIAIGGQNEPLALASMDIYVDSFILTQNEPAGGS